MQIKGIDVSHNQGNIDWQKVKLAGLEFAFIKATEGIGFIDPKFHENWQALQTQGINRGAYHFFRAGDDAEQQARHFLDTVINTGFNNKELSLVLDIEVNDNVDSNTLIQQVSNCLNIIENKIHEKPIIYTNHAFWDAHMNGDFGEYPLWIADWNPRREPRLPQGWNTWTYWQISSKGRIDGILGDVDIDIQNGARA